MPVSMTAPAIAATGIGFENVMLPAGATIVSPFFPRKNVNVVPSADSNDARGPATVRARRCGQPPTFRPYEAK